MDDARPEVAYALALLRTPGIGPTNHALLLERFGSARRALAWLARTGRMPRGHADDGVGRAGVTDWRGVERDLKWLAAPGHHLLTLDDAAYPPLLREIADPPPLLFVTGDPAVLARPQVAMVGSRNPSPGGREHAAALARALARSGLTITSGLAVGIDAAAHHGALQAGGHSIAVAGTGPDRVYPQCHGTLAREITGRGALVTEFPTGTPPRREHFPRRNRIISGLSLGVLVVEAALRSGSRITARHAADQGRDVFAVPGSIENPLARGCHALLREGAKLVEAADDVLEEIYPDASRPAPSARVCSAPEPGADQRERRVLEAIGHDAVAVDRLIERTGLTADAVSAILLSLELRGLVAAAAGGLYVRAGTGP